MSSSSRKTQTTNLDRDRSRIRYARELLQKYRAAKQSLDARIAADEKFWQLRHGVYLEQPEDRRPQPTSAWLFNSIANRHADLMDSMPASTCLAREKEDVADAEMLSKIIPAICERCRFPSVYADNTWDKLKHGNAVYGVFWNSALEGGLGDIDICKIDLRNLYPEPGVRHLQDSKNLFYLTRVDRAELEARYPCYKDAPEGKKQGERDGRHAEYEGYGDTGREDGRVTVVDWYYKVPKTCGGHVLHYAKFAGEVMLYASEEDPLYAKEGWYRHGLYPFVMDTLYPERDSCYGFGLISIAKDPQLYIDRMDKNLMEYMDWSSRVRFFAKKSTGINEADFCDLNRRIVEVEGDLSEERLHQITLQKMDDSVVEIKRLKVDELKETTGNRDVSQGSTLNVTAATAILALQEAGKKGARDAIFTSFRAFEEIITQAVELIRQFYDQPRCFRIAGESGQDTYLTYTNQGIREKKVVSGGMTLYRRPAFDIVITAREKSPSEKQLQNEFAMTLFRDGAFRRENAAQTLMMLDLMDFEGIEKMRAGLRELYGTESPRDAKER